MPAVNPLKVPVVAGPGPNRVNPPGEAVTVQFPDEGSPLSSTLPVASAQVGCVMVPTTGAGGANGSLSVAFTPVAEVQVLAVIRKLL